MTQIDRERLFSSDPLHLIVIIEFAHCEAEASSWSKSSKSGQEKEEAGENQLLKEKLKKDEETNGEGLEGEEVRNLYKSQFHPIEYMRQYCTKIAPEEGFFLTKLHQFFQEKQQDKQNGKLKTLNNIDARPRIVHEVGSGPLISGVHIENQNFLSLPLPTFC